MSKVDKTDIVAGGLLTAVGAAVAVYSQITYDMGSLRSMGPGMFPFGLGVILAVLGLCIFLPGFTKQAEVPKIEWRPLLLTLGAVGAVALTLENLGLVPASVVLSVLAVFADRRGTWRRALGLAIALPILAASIFILGLGVPVSLFESVF